MLHFVMVTPIGTMAEFTLGVGNVSFVFVGAEGFDFGLNGFGG